MDGHPSFAQFPVGNLVLQLHENFTTNKFKPRFAGPYKSDVQNNGVFYLLSIECEVQLGS